jgi:hypothetical protein
MIDFREIRAFRQAQRPNFILIKRQEQMSLLQYTTNMNGLFPHHTRKLAKLRFFLPDLPIAIHYSDACRAIFGAGEQMAGLWVSGQPPR